MAPSTSTHLWLCWGHWKTGPPIFGVTSKCLTTTPSSKSNLLIKSGGCLTLPIRKSPWFLKHGSLRVGKNALVPRLQPMPFTSLQTYALAIRVSRRLHCRPAPPKIPFRPKLNRPGATLRAAVPKPLVRRVAHSLSLPPAPSKLIPKTLSLLPNRQLLRLGPNQQHLPKTTSWTIAFRT